MSTMTKSAIPLAGGSEQEKVILENDRVRVLHIHMEPGERIEMHSHPDMVAYALSDVSNRFEFPDGTSQQMEFHQGDALFHEGFAHAAVNTGDRDADILVVEIKQ